MLVLLLLAASTSQTSASDPASRLEADVRRITETWPSRNSDNPEVLELVADHIAAEFERAGLEVLRQEFSVDGREYQNVRALVGPQTGPRLVVGAHYDVAGDGPGADDNASGVAVLLELARRLAGEAPATSIELVAYTLEEPPFFATENMGSAHHARLISENSVEVTLMISLEMLGVFSDEVGSQSYPIEAMSETYPQQGDFLAVVGRPEDCEIVMSLERSVEQHSSLPIETLCVPRTLEVAGFSDHRNYWDHGYNAVMITDTAFLRNPNYHTTSDTYATLDYQRMAKAYEGIAEAVLRLSGRGAPTGGPRE